MLLQTGHSRVKALGLSHVSLTETLRPWWQIPKVCGLLLNWCHPLQPAAPSRNIFTILTYFGIGVSLSLITALTAYQFTQLLIGIWKMTTVHEIIPNFYWFIYLPFCLGLQLSFLIKRNEFLSFMDEWNALESKLFDSPYYSNDVTAPLRSVRRFLHCSYALILLCLIAGLASSMYRDPEATYLLTHYSFLRDTFGSLALSILHLIGVTIAFFFMSLAESVPALVFYHGALMVRILTLQTNSLFTWLKPARFTDRSKDLRLMLNSASTSISFSFGLRQVWSQYEQLSNLIGRANFIFGYFIVFSHGIKLFGICSVTYSVLHKYQTEPATAGGNFTSLFTQVFSLASNTLLAARLYCSTVRLRSTLASLLSSHWDNVPKEDHSILSVFLSRLQSEPLAASPLHLYQISPSLLLSIASLTVTYLVILLQSK